MIRGVCFSLMFTVAALSVACSICGPPLWLVNIYGVDGRVLCIWGVGLTSLLIDGTDRYVVKYASILQQNIPVRCKYRIREWYDAWEDQTLSDANLTLILIDVEMWKTCIIYSTHNSSLLHLLQNNLTKSINPFIRWHFIVIGIATVKETHILNPSEHVTELAALMYISRSKYTVIPRKWKFTRLIINIT